MRPLTRSTFLKKDGLSLQHFLLRTEILKAYRSAVRATRPLPDIETRRETLDWFRSDLDKLKNETSIEQIKAELAHFNRTAKQFLPSLGLSTAGTEGTGARLIGQKITRQARKSLMTRTFFE